MKKMLFLIFVLALVVVGVAAVTSAQDGAVVINDQGCSNGGLGGIPLYSNETLRVTTPSGNSNITCHYDIPEDATFDGPVFKDAGFLCITPLGITNDSKYTMNKNRAVLVCSVKANK